MAEPIGALRAEMSAGWAQFQSDMHKARDAVKNSGTAMQRSMDKAKKSFDLTSLSITKLVGAVGGVYMVKQLMTIADTYTLMDNKLKLVTGSASELKYVQDGLYQQSLRSFSSYESSVDLYSRFAKATETLGTSQGELLRITETLNKAMIISGATQEESKNAIIQLSQGMASGVLRGEEFNSIMENGSRISKMLADYLKVDIGQLREMAKEGKITSETMIKAFAAATDTIENEFSKMQPTIDQAMTNLKTVFGRLLSDSNKSAEGTKSVAEEIMKLADTIEQNKPGIIELFTEIIALAGKAARAIGNIGQSLQGWTAVKRGDLGIGEFATMGPDDLKKWLAANDTQEKRLQNRIAKLQQKRAGAILPHYQIPIDKEIAELEAKLEAVRKGAESDAANYLPSGRQRTYTGDKDKDKKKKKTDAEKLAEAAEKEILQLQREGAAIGDVTREEQMLWEVTKGKYKDLSASQKERLVAIASEIDSLKTQNEAEKEIIKNWEENEKTIDGLKEQAATIGMTEAQIELYKLSLKDATKEQMESASATLADIEQKTALKQILEDIRSPYQDYLDKIATANSLLVTGQLSIEDYALYMSKLSEEMEKLTDDGKDQFKELKDAIEGWGKDSAKAIADFAVKGAGSFSDMAESIIADLLQMMIYQQMMKPLFSGISTSLFGDAATGATGLLSGLFGGGKASGGSVSPGKMYEVNETGMPELLNIGNRQFLMMGNRSGSVVAATRASSSGGGSSSPSVNVIINNNNNSDVSQQSQPNGNGGFDLVVTVDNLVAKNLNKHGSSSSKALRKGYGARPTLTGR